MIEIRQILCPVDFSDASRHAFEHAAVLARWYEARLTLLNVLPAPLLPSPQIVMAGYYPTEVAARDRAVAERTLNSWLGSAECAGLQKLAFTAAGNVPAQIIETAAALPADLIVMGTHGVGGFERFVIGSVAARVLRKAPIPVLTVPPSAGAAVRLPYKRILCAIDFSDSSLTALEFACSLAKEADARLTILHVFDWRPSDDRLIGRFDVPEFRRTIEQDVRERLDALVTDDMREWCDPQTRTAHGKAYLGILDTAAEEQSDLIVIGVHGRNPIDVALFGSTANHVVQRAPCPVLTLRR